MSDLKSRMGFCNKLAVFLLDDVPVHIKSCHVLLDCSSGSCLIAGLDRFEDLLVIRYDPGILDLL